MAIEIKPNSKWKDALNLKQQTRLLMIRQEVQGVYFDIDYAKEVWDEINAEMGELEEEVNKLLPLKNISKSKVHHPPKKQFKQDGTPSKLVKKYVEIFGGVLEESCGEWFACFKEDDWINQILLPLKEPLETQEPMTISNQKDMKEWLQSQGWVPTLWNFKKDKRNRKMRDERGRLIKTSPKMQEMGKLCPNLARLRGNLAKKVVRYLSLRNRRSTLKGMSGDTGWLVNTRLLKDHRLPAGSSGITNTGRQKHTVVANVPKAKEKVIYGIPFRKMFKPTPAPKGQPASQGYKFVGYDAAQLEARVEAHYTWKYDDGVYARTILEGRKEDGTDIHTINAGVFGVDYDIAKNGKYALTYGCTAAKLAETLGKSKREGQRLYDDFWAANPSLAQLKDAVTRVWKMNHNTWIRNIDGGKLYSRSEHSILNLLFQATGATIMDLAGVIMDEWVEILNRRYPDADVRRVIYYHDEYIFEYRESMGDEFGERLGEMGCESIREAGRRLGLAIPLDGDYKIGGSWSDVH